MSGLNFFKVCGLLSMRLHSMLLHLRPMGKADIAYSAGKHFSPGRCSLVQSQFVCMHWYSVPSKVPSALESFPTDIAEKTLPHLFQSLASVCVKQQSRIIFKQGTATFAGCRSLALLHSELLSPPDAEKNWNFFPPEKRNSRMSLIPYRFLPTALWLTMSLSLMPKPPLPSLGSFVVNSFLPPSWLGPEIRFRSGSLRPAGRSESID